MQKESVIPVPTTIDYETIIPEFIEAKIDNPHLPIKRFCEERSIEYCTFHKHIRKHPTIMESILKGIRERYHEKSMKVDAALLAKAEKGDPRAIELWYKRMENWNIKQEEQGKQIVVIIPPYLVSMKKRSSEPIEITTEPCKTEIIDNPDEESCLNGTQNSTQGNVSSENN